MGSEWSFSQIKQEPFKTQKSGLKPEVRASSLASTEPPQTPFLTMGIIVGLVLLVLAVVAGAVIWRRNAQVGKGGRDLSFLVSLRGFKPR